MGRPAAATFAAYPGRRFEGKVQFVYPTIEPQSRTLKVRVALANPKLELRPGMYGDVELQAPAAEGLVIPAEALVDTGEMQYVFVAREGGRFEPRRVRAGARAGGKVQVLEGLSEGEVVVTTGNFFLDSESSLRARVSGPSAAPAPSACDRDFDKQKFPEKYQQCLACEREHRGMGTMEEDCKNAIPKPWK